MKKKTKADRPESKAEIKKNRRKEISKDKKRMKKTKKARKMKKSS